MSRQQQAQSLDTALERLIDEAQRQLQAEGIEADMWCCEEPAAPLTRCDKCEVPVCGACGLRRGLCENCYEREYNQSKERWN